MFKKYHHIESAKKPDVIAYWERTRPDALNVPWIGHHKFDGQCVFIGLSPTTSINEYILGSHNCQISKEQDFSGVRELLREEEYQKLLEYMSTYAVDQQVTVVGYFELFGPGIRKDSPIKYDKKRLRCFDMMFDDTLISQKMLNRFLDNIEIRTNNVYSCPILFKTETLQEALNYTIDFVDMYSTNQHLVEGVVLKPWNEPIYDTVGKLMYFKHKNTWSLEESKPYIPTDAELAHKSVFEQQISVLQAQVLAYLNERRIETVFGHYGRITERKQFGQYIRYILDDIWEEFLADHKDELAQYDQKVIKGARNIGKQITPYLEKELIG